MALSVCGNAADKKGRELTEHGSVLFPIACYDSNLERNNVPWHWHDELEFIIITEGAAQIQVENNTIPLRQGGAILINSGSLHNIDNGRAANTNYHSLVFHARLIGGSIDSIFWQRLISPMIQDKSFRYLCFDCSYSWQAEIVADMAAAWQAAADEPEDYENFVRYRLSRAFHLLHINHPMNPVKTTERERLSVERTKTMMQYIEEHYGEEISLELIAASASVSKSVCLRCFRQAIGTTPVRYLLQYRIEKAAGLLAATDEKVNSIAMSCGFLDISYFTKCFRELKECAPLEYRNTYRSLRCK